MKRWHFAFAAGVVCAASVAFAQSEDQPRGGQLRQFGQDRQDGQGGQDRQGGQDQLNRQNRQDRGGDSQRGQRDNSNQDDQRRQWRDRMDRTRNASPEERERMRADGYVRMLSRTYDLNDDQQQQVREEVVMMNREYRESLGADGKEMDRLREEMDSYWRGRMQNNGEDRRDRRNRDGQNPWQDPKFREMSEQMRAIQEKHPMDWEGSMKRIESILPPEQVAKARERRDQWMNQNGPGGRGGQGGPGGGFGGGRGNRNGDPAARNQNGDPQRGRRGNRGGGGGANPDQRDPSRSDDPNSRPPRSETQQRLESASGGAGSTVSAPILSVGPRHPWDIYTDNFIRDRSLDRAQTASAQSVLKSMKDREAALRKAQTADRAAAEKILNPTSRAQRVKQLDEPVDVMFNELKARLDALLTAEQRGRP